MSETDSGFKTSDEHGSLTSYEGLERDCTDWLQLELSISFCIYCVVIINSPTHFYTLLSTPRQEAVVISGRKLARQIREETRADVEKWVLAGNSRPHLSVVLVGDDPASHSYVLNKTRAAADVGKRWGEGGAYPQM